MKKKPIHIAILSLAALQMVVGGLSAALSALSAAFPDASTLLIQMTTSGIGISVLVMSFLTDAIYAKFTRRSSAIAGVAMLMVVAVAAYLVHPGIEIVFVYSLCIGVACSLYIPAVGSAILDYYEGEEKVKMSGWQSVFSSVGGIGFSILGGVLATITWYTTYLVYLLVIPTLILCVLYFPEDKPVTPKEKETQGSKFSPEILRFGGIALLFVTLFGVSGSNLSLFLAEEGIGNAATAGLLGGLGMLGGVIGGFLFRPVTSALKGYSFTFTFAGLAAGFLLLSVADNVAVCVIAVLISGIAQCIHMPLCLIRLSDRITPAQAVLGSSAVCCIAPNLGNIISPLVLTNVSTALFGDVIRPRFLMTAAIAAAAALLFAANNLMKKGGHTHE